MNGNSMTSAALTLICIAQYYCIRGKSVYPRKEMSTPAATAEPMTPLMLLDMQ